MRSSLFEIVDAVDGGCGHLFARGASMGEPRGLE